MKCLLIPLDKVSVLRVALVARSREYEAQANCVSPIKRQTSIELANFFRDLANDLANARGYPERVKGRAR